MPTPTNWSGVHPLLSAFGPDVIRMDDESLLDEFLTVDARLIEVRERQARLEAERDKWREYAEDIIEAFWAKEHGAPPVPSHDPAALLRKRPLAQLADMAAKAAEQVGMKERKLARLAAEREDLPQYGVYAAEVVRRFLRPGSTFDSFQISDVYVLLSNEGGEPSVMVIRDWLPADGL